METKRTRRINSDEVKRLGTTVDAVAHSRRFRQVSNGYPRLVAQAYAGNIVQAQADSDDTVAATVARWRARERRQHTKTER